MPKGKHKNHSRGDDHYLRRGWVPPCSKAELERFYFKHERSQKEIADALGCSLKKVQGAMRRFGIKPRGAVARDQRGTKNSNWKGAEAQYAAMHRRVGVVRGRPRRCESCGTTRRDIRYEWASLTGKFDDPSDYARLCVKCHRKMDAAARKQA